ncbi:hypothetical protein D030_0601A, partial [Vibrio parahaemolyticus AQ3810]
MAFQRWQ